jgi:hypothetical protein
MAQVFALNQPVTTTTSTLPSLINLGVGTYVFTLVVVDEEGNQSAPARATVTIVPIVIK